MLRHHHDAGVRELMHKDRIGHAMPGMDGTYLHVTPESRRDCCEALENLFWNAISSVPHDSPARGGSDGDEVDVDPGGLGQCP